MIYPWEYTDKEGVYFKLWTYGGVTRGQLSKLIRKIGDPDPIINGVQVHSLIFESASAGEGMYARWDCINGWTTTLRQAKKNNPLGYHGQRHKFNTK